MATWFPVIVPMMIITTINGQITPIINETGEYFIASTLNSFKNANITCNTSIAHCYVICPDLDICTNANIECGSPACNIKCGADSCKNININTSNSFQTTIVCGNNDESVHSCTGLQLNSYAKEIDFQCYDNACNDA
eukprot:33369_1